MAKKDEIDIDAIMNSTKVECKQTAKKKDDKPEHVLPKAESAALKQFAEFKAAERKAKAGANVTKQLPCAYIMAKMDEDALAGNVYSSCRVTTDDGKVTLTYITSDVFSINQDEENVKQLKEILGSDFDKCVEKVKTTSIKPEVLEDKALLTKLIKLVGPSEFAKFFETTELLVAKDNLKQDIYAIAKTKERLNQIREFITQSSAHLK